MDIIDRVKYGDFLSLSVIPQDSPERSRKYSSYILTRFLFLLMLTQVMLGHTLVCTLLIVSSRMVPPLTVLLSSGVFPIHLHLLVPLTSFPAFHCVKYRNYTMTSLGATGAEVLVRSPGTVRPRWCVPGV